MAKKKLEIDMIAGSQLRDTQGEMLSVEGADISDLERGLGRFNDNHGKGFFNSIGRITEAKKIYSEEDCGDNARQKYFWEKVKAPYIYVKGFLYDDEDHQNAKAAAAIIRNIHKSDCPLKIKASVEGGVLARGIKDSTLLAQTKIHSVALTFTPANMATLVEPTSLDKSAVDETADMILIKSVIHLAQHDVPNFRMVAKAASAAKIARNIKQMQKAIQKMKEEELEKAGLRSKIAGAALATGLVTGGAPSANAPQVSQTKPAASLQNNEVGPTKSFDAHPNIVEGLKATNPELWGIAQLESSGGKNLNHKTMNKGIHKGQTAAGAWGMMPKTAAYVMKMSKKLQQKYPGLAKDAQDIDNNHKNITNALNKDPNMAYELAKTLHDHLKGVYGNDSNKILHSWHYGINGTKKALDSGKELNQDAYVQKISNYINDLHNVKKPASVEKALTAGYGGSGFPTNQSGGGVFQTESLEDGRPKFKYVTCEHCGDEQIHSKHQVKCRGCGKPWSLAKLVKLIG